MKLSIVIFILATMTCKYQCTPNSRGWVAGTLRYSKNEVDAVKHQKKESQQQPDYELKVTEREQEERPLRQQEELRQKQQENYIHRRLIARKIYKEKQRRKQRQQKQHRRQLNAEELQEDERFIIYIDDSSQLPHGDLKFRVLQYSTIGDTEEQTITQFSLLTNTTEIIKYKCPISKITVCVPESIETKNGLPSYVYHTIL